MDKPNTIEKCEQDIYEAIYRAHGDGLSYQAILLPLLMVTSGVELMAEAEIALNIPEKPENAPV